MKRFTCVVVACVCAAGLLSRAQGLDPARLLKPATDSWPTYNGDYSGRRFSTLTKINANNIGALSLAWV
jgi:alcohol dehydrogenase (cytochrome c)